MPEDGGIAISLQGVGKRFGDVVAVRETNLDIRDGEFFSMLGPSGCGKTTTLRMIAGFEVPDEGRVVLRGADVTNVPPNQRNVNTVFQHYALFPHMSVVDNVSFGLELKRVPRGERRDRVKRDAARSSSSKAWRSASRSSSRAASSSVSRSPVRS